MQFYLATKRDKFESFIEKQMAVETMLNKINQTWKVKYHMVS